jgi:hypothetical protein
MAQRCKFLRVYTHFGGMESRRFKLYVWTTHALLNWVLRHMINLPLFKPFKKMTYLTRGLCYKRFTIVKL